MKELYNAPKAEVINFVSEQAMAATWNRGTVQLSLNIADLFDEPDNE